MEMPGSVPVTEKLCARRARFTCVVPPFKIEHGFRVAPNDSRNRANLIKQVSCRFCVCALFEGANNAISLSTPMF